MFTEKSYGGMRRSWGLPRTGRGKWSVNPNGVPLAVTNACCCLRAASKRNIFSLIRYTNQTNKSYTHRRTLILWIVKILHYVKARRLQAHSRIDEFNTHQINRLLTTPRMGHNVSDLQELRFLKMFEGSRGARSTIHYIWTCPHFAVVSIEYVTPGLAHRRL